MSLVGCSVALLTAMALAACARAPTDNDLFPLDSGGHWTYTVTTTLDNETATKESLTLTTLGRDDLDAQPTWHRRSSDGADYWLRSDATGIYRVASKSELDAEPKPDAARRYVLHTPYVVGTQWQASTTAYLMRRSQEFPREIRHSHPVMAMTYQIEAVGQAVSTPAGEFTGCLRVKGTATLRLYADPVAGWRDLPLTTLEWYCPGAGMVRLERVESSESAGKRAGFVSGGTLTMELAEWKAP